MRLKMLVIRWSGMGDIIMTLPAIQWLGDHFEGCHISYLTDIAFAKILEKSGLVHRIVTIDRRGFTTGSRFFSAAMNTLKTIFHLRREKIDIVFDLQGFGETALIAFLTGAPVCVGKINNSPLRKRFYTVPIQADWVNEHRSRYFIRAVAEACGVNAPAAFAPPELRIIPDAKRTAPQRIGLNIGASTESRRWSVKKFFELAKLLSGKGFDVHFFLGPQEEFLIKTTQTECRQNNWNFSCHTRMETLMEALSQCRLLISNDTGPGHLAAAMGIDVITLFSSGIPDNVKPLAKQAAWFRNETDINRINVADVEKACLEILSAARH